MKFLNKTFIRQFLIFCVIGGINTLIDLGIFNLFSYLFGLAGAWSYVSWKTLGFIGAAINSYFMNRYFTFGNKTDRSRTEFYRFALVTIGTFIISTGITTLLFMWMTNGTELSAIVIGNICALVGVAINVIVNFIGYKLFVFNK